MAALYTAGDISYLWARRTSSQGMELTEGLLAMGIVYAIKDAIGHIEISIGAVEGASSSGRGDAERLALFLEKRPIKAAVVVLVDGGEDSTVETDEAGLLPIRDALASATVPLGAVLWKGAGSKARLLARACHFAFDSKALSKETLIEAARAHLASLTLRRPEHVIRAVMRSVGHGDTLPTRQCLLEETRLFCELSKRSGEGK